MKLTPFNPASLTRVSDFDEWFRHPFAGLPSLPSLSQFFGNLPDFFAPITTGRLAVDFYEDKDTYYARFEVPGVKKEDMKVELENQLLTVTVEKKEKSDNGGESYTLTRSVSVPEGVKADSISAKLEDGVLTVSLPKAEDRKPKTIDIV